MAAPQTYTGNGLTVTITDPENITKDECLQLARAGKDAWNSWRRAFGVTKQAVEFVNYANFAKTDFRTQSVNFDGFEFGHGALFYETQFGDWATFVAAEFGDLAKFSRAEFGDRATFNGAQFGDWATFEGAQFGTTATFEGARFGRGTKFQGAQFNQLAVFTGVQFGERAILDGAQFGGWAGFYGAIFGDRATFDGTQFSGSASFDGALFLANASFAADTWAGLDSIYGEALPQRHAWAQVRGLAPNAFQGISFAGTKFNGSVDFANRHFLGTVTFSRLKRELTHVRPIVQNGKPLLDDEDDIVWDASKNISEGTPTRFAVAPIFHGCQLHQDTSFDGAEFPNAHGDEAAARAYRTLKLAFAQQQAIREEQRFFKLEMQEEAARESGWKRWLYRGYDYFSDYGFSIWRPLARLVLWPGLGFLLGYSLLMALNHTPLQTGPLIDEPALLSQWLQFTFANLAPLPDSELLKDLRGKLFDHEGKTSLISVAALVLETTQKLLALIGYFLMGLALRNLFKMK